MSNVPALSGAPLFRRPGSGTARSSALVPTFGRSWEPAYAVPAAGSSHLPLAIILLTTVAFSTALIPRGQELALLRLEAGDFGRALSMLERKYAEGDRSGGTLAALARTRASLGDIEGAIGLLESHVRERPRDRRALETLAGYYRQAHRKEELLTTLVRLQSLWPAAVRLREIAHLQGSLGMQAEQLQTLRSLIEHDGGEPAEYLTLARLEAAAGSPARGLAVLHDMARFYPASAETAEAVALETSLLLAAGEADGAVARGHRWLAGQADDMARAGLTLSSVFFTANRPDLIVALLEPHVGAGAPPELLAAIVQAESDMGRPTAALRRLEGFLSDGYATSPDLGLLRLRLALALGEVDRGMSAAASLGFERIPPESLVALARLALDAKRPDILGRIRSDAGEGFLSLDPALSAELLLALGDETAARRWSDEALGSVAGNPVRTVRLATVRLQLGQNEGVAELLRQALPEAVSHPALLGEIARLYTRMGQAEEGRIALGALRGEQPSAVDGAWALAATAAGHGAEVAAWLAATGPQEFFPGFLADLMSLAADVEAYPLAIAVAEHLATQRGTAEDHLRLARLLVAADRPREALAPLRLAQSQGAVPEELYAHVLTLAWRQGEPVAEELRSLWSRRLTEATSTAQRDASISMLLELGGHAEVLPVLRRLALAEPDRWVWVFGDVAKRAGRPGDAASLWAELAARGGTRPELRRQLAFRLLESGDKASAERIFRSLAATARPDSAEVRQLLFLWGPRPGPERLAWLEERARRAGGEEKAAWMRALTERGGAARAVAVYRATEAGTASEATRDAYLAALGRLGNRSALAAALREELRRPASAARLQHLANLAGATGDAALEEEALRALVAVGGGTPRAQRQLGMAAYRSRDLATAERLLTRFTATTGGDYETHFILGEIRSKQRDSTGARKHYQQAILALDSASGRNSHARAVRAVVLNRLGYAREAMRLYETLLAERPQDRNLRADYVALLLAEGELRKAREVLAAR